MLKFTWAICYLTSTCNMLPDINLLTCTNLSGKSSVLCHAALLLVTMTNSLLQGHLAFDDVISHAVSTAHIIACQMHCRHM